MISPSVPRLILLVLAIFTGYFSQVWPEGFVWPVLGWIFLPWTTLAFLMLNIWTGGVDTAGVFVMIVAVLADLATHHQVSSTVRVSNRDEP